MSHATPSQRATAVARALVGSSPEIVYYLRRGRFVKIGTTSSLRRRMATLMQHRDPDGKAGALTLWYAEPGGRDSAVAPPGEWFYITDDLYGYILHGLRCHRLALRPGGREWMVGRIQQMAADESAALRRQHPEIDWERDGLHA
jgi:hypothetical protein